MGRVWPRHRHRGRPLNSVVRQHMRHTPWIVVAIVGVVLLANFVVLAATFMPFLVTYADVPPQGITCAQCANPEVQGALARAAAYGRSEILIHVQRVWLWWFLPAAINVVAPFVIWRVARGKGAV